MAVFSPSTMVHVDGLVGYFYDTIVEEEVGQ